MQILKRGIITSVNTTQDFLNIILTLGLLVITVCIVYVSYYLVKALKSVTNLSDSLEDTAQGIKDKIQIKALAAIPALLVAIAGKIIKKKRG
ncbi:MAG: hypothetical protein PHE48_02760 [Candidatus Daviesbacteria bacterium]|nr:hypothetical protein [Candidatus Daviesbacteria bacterium]